MKNINITSGSATPSSLDTLTNLLGVNEPSVRRRKSLERKKLMEQQKQNQKKGQSTSGSRGISTQKTSSKQTTRSNTKMTQAHIVLQPKGGVGKSVVASFISQFLRSQGKPFIAIDTDPNHATLLGYKALNVQRLQIMKNGALMERSFDALIEQILSDKENSFVIDNGSSNFNPFLSYIKKNNVVDVLNSEGKQVYIHTVIKGGQEVKITLAGFDALAEHTPPEAKIIVWLNEFMSEVKGDGKTFEQMKVYQKSKDRVAGIVKLEDNVSTTEGQDVRQMLNSSLIFDEVKDSPDFSRMSKNRLNIIKGKIFSQLEKAIQ